MLTALISIRAGLSAGVTIAGEVELTGADADGASDATYNLDSVSLRPDHRFPIRTGQTRRVE